jgi:hypothetical protein
MANVSDPGSAAPPRDSPSEAPNSSESPEQAFASLHQRLDEFGDYLAYYLITRLDALKFAVKRRLLTGALGLIAVLAAAGTIITAVCLLCEGISDGLSVLFGHRWLGEIVTGVLLLGGVAIAGWISVERLVHGPHLRTVKRYEELRRRQRERYGRDVKDRAHEEADHG